MGKKFIFNPETLTFEEKKFSLVAAIKSILPHLLITVAFGSILGYTLFSNVQTPELRRLERQNAVILSDYQVLAQQIDNQNNRLEFLESRDDNTFRTVLGLKPIPKVTRLLGYGGNTQYNNIDLSYSSNIINDLNKKSASIQNRIKLEAESYNLILSMVKDREKMINSIPAICPLSNKDLKRIGSGFGYRMHPILHVVKMHTGVDLSADRGAPVYASGDGMVIRADASSGGYGNCIRINHGYSYQTVYAHLNKMLVSPGQIVKRGQLIGLVGSTGRSTSPHLHYEVRINNNPVNPLNYFYNDMSEDEYETMISNAAGESVQE